MKKKDESHIPLTEIRDCSGCLGFDESLCYHPDKNIANDPSKSCAPDCPIYKKVNDYMEAGE